MPSPIARHPRLLAHRYYSLDVYQDVQSIESVGKCERQPPLADYSKAKPDKAIRAYRVDRHVNYEPGDHPISLSCHRRR